MFKRYGMFPSLSVIAKSLPTMLNVFTTRGDLVRAGAGATPERFAPSVAGQAAIFDGLDTVFGTPSVVTVRQTQRLGPVDSSGYNATLSAGAGLNFNVDASPTAVVLDFAAGSVDYTATLTADASNQGSLAASNTNYIHATYVSPTSVTWSNCLVPPQYGYAFDRTQCALLNFEGANGATTTTDDFGNTVTLTGATISTTQFKFGASALRIGGVAHRASWTFTSLGDGSWVVEDWFRPDNAASGGATNVFKLENGSGFGALVTLDATGHLTWYLSSTGSSHDIASGTAGATVLANNTWYKIRLQFDALAGTYKLYLSNNGGAEVAELSASSTSRICGLTSANIGYSSAAAQGYHDAVRILRCATNTSTETPSVSAPTITDYPVHFFSIPKMTMYEVTAASASAGTDPTLTAKNRVFVGEQDTNGSAVTATRNYALMGRYEGYSSSALAAATGYNFNHNLGTRLYTAKSLLKCVTSQYYYNPGDVVENFYDGNAGTGGNLSGQWVWQNGRNTAQVVTGSGVGLVPRPDSPTTLAAVTSANWVVGMRVQRTF